MVRFTGDAKQKSRKIFLEKRNFTFVQVFTVPLSKKKGKILKQLAEFEISIKMKQIFHNFTRSFEEKTGLKSKTLFKRLK